MDARAIETAGAGLPTASARHAPAQLIVLDGKEPNHTGGQRVLTAVTVPSQHYLGCIMVADKSNGIPAARELFTRLDLSRRDDQCRMRARKGVWVHGIFSRLANSLFMEWRSHQRKPPHHSTTDFAAQMAAEHGRRVILTVTTRRPKLHSRS